MKVGGISDGNYKFLVAAVNLQQVRDLSASTGIYFKYHHESVWKLIEMSNLDINKNNMREWDWYIISCPVYNEDKKVFDIYYIKYPTKFNNLHRSELGTKIIKNFKEANVINRKILEEINQLCINEQKTSEGRHIFDKDLGIKGIDEMFSIYGD